MRYVLLSTLPLLIVLAGFLSEMVEATDSTNSERISVREASKSIEVSTGPMTFVFDTQIGLIRSVEVGSKQLVRDNTLPLLAATLIEIDDFDQVHDQANGKKLPGRQELDSFTYETDGVHFEARLRGRLAFPDGDRFDWQMTLHAEAGESQLRTNVTFQPYGTFRNRYVHALVTELPLALDHRKRVSQGGDRGMSWDTRYFYQFHLSPVATLLEMPDRNEWRYFSVDQQASNAFRIWRAESESTAPLVMQYGVRAAGWTTVYDAHGGVCLNLRDMAERAPASLFIDAAGGGRASVLLHPNSSPAVAPASTQARDVLFDNTHTIDWLFFKGDPEQVRPQQMLAEQPQESTLSSDPPVRFDAEAMREANELWRTPAIADENLPMVNGGLALPRGALIDPTAVRLFEHGRERPLQTHALAYWPDRSVKWLLLTFPLNRATSAELSQGSGDGERVSFDVTLRDDSRRTFELVYGPDVRAPTPKRPLLARQQGDAVRISTGPLEMVVRSGSHWLGQVKHKGRTVLRSGDTGSPLAFADFLRTGSPYFPNSTHPTGDLDPGPVHFDTIELEEAGPLRAVVRLEGKAHSQEPARIVLRLEAYAGQSSVRVFHTIEFTHQDPRNVFLQQMGITLPLRVDKANTRVLIGGQKSPMQLQDLSHAGLFQRNHLSYDIWRRADGADRHAGPTRLEQGRHARGWLSMSGQSDGLMVVIRNMWQDFPKALTANVETGELTIGLWPAQSPLMDMRRYSNYWHRSQGESPITSIGATIDDVAERFYAQEPVVGVSRTHEMLWHFHGTDMSPDELDAIAADFQSPPLVYAGEAHYRQAGVMLPRGDTDRFPRVTSTLDDLLDFWLNHQWHHGWFGFWNHGDFQHYFNSGYGWTLPPERLRDVLAKPESERYSTRLADHRVRDYFPQHNWAFDNGRWGWSNTEGLPGLFLQREYLRTGRRDVFFAAEAMARHARDVVVRHSGHWFGRGTRHGVQHWSDGNHDERQTIVSEFRFHHYLTGDARTRDVISRLAKEVYLKGRIHRHAAHSGRLYGLLTYWEMTGDPEIERVVADYVQAFATPRGINIEPAVRFPQVTVEGEPRSLHGSSMFFHTFGGMHALLEYYYLTEDDSLRTALVQTADHVVQRTQTRETWVNRGLSSVNPYWLVVAFAARHADEPEPYQTLLNKWFGSDAGAPLLFQLVPANREHWFGDSAFLAGSVPVLKMWINALPYVLASLESEPEPTPDQVQEMAARESDGLPRNPPRLDWQADYDQPAFDAYLGVHRPWFEAVDDSRDEAD